MNVHELTLQNYAAGGGCPSACQPMLYLGTAGSYGNEQINVVLGEGWQGLTVKAVFQPTGVPVVVPDGGGVISVPWEATQSVIAYPKGRISFQGYVSGRLVNTSDVPYTVGGSSAGSDNTPAPTPDEFQQFVDAVKSDADRAAQATADAKAAVQEVKDAGTQAVTDIGNAKDSALEAIDKAREEAAGSISADVEGAKQAAAQAERSAKDAAATLEKVQSAGQSALDDIATERQNTLSDIQNEGAKQQSAVAGAGTAALEAIGQTEQAAINQIKQTGETQVGAVQSAGTTQISQINSAGAAQVQAVKDEGAAQTSALDDAAAAHKTELEAIASHPPQPNTETGKWQVWNAETGAYQDTDALYQGGYYTASVSDDGTLTWQGSQEGMPELPSVNIKGPKGDKGDPGLGVPSPAQSDAGKVPTVKADGSAYELAGPYAPLSAAIRPTANGNPVNITDSVEWPLQGLKVYGKSTQDGVPSPESPVPIVSAGDGGSIGLTVSNSADQSQSLILSTPNGLPGIFVGSGEQQLVCDEVDFARGVYVQRVKKIVISDSPSVARQTNYDGDGFYGFNVQADLSGFISSQNLNNSIISEKFSSSLNTIPTSVYQCRYWPNMNTVYFTLESDSVIDATNIIAGTTFMGFIYPIETPLSEVEIAAYRAIHTYDGTTVVSTAEDVAGLDVRYVANAQKYIDDRLDAAESHIQEIAAAQLNAQTGG